MKSILTTLGCGAFLFIITSASQAAVITIDADDYELDLNNPVSCTGKAAVPNTLDCWIRANKKNGGSNSNPDADEIEALTGTATELTLLYKANVGTTVVEEGEAAYQSAYQTTFSNSATDPEDALIDYLSGVVISCPVCFLSIKDGNQNPSLYIFDISSWNGTDDLVMQDFWVGNGAISNVAIWGGTATVPAPATVLLLGLGLCMMGFARGRSAANY